MTLFYLGQEEEWQGTEEGDQSSENDVALLLRRLPVLEEGLQYQDEYLGNQKKKKPHYNKQDITNWPHQHHHHILNEAAALIRRRLTFSACILNQVRLTG